MKVEMGMTVQRKSTKQLFRVDRIHPFAREIDLDEIPDTVWDFDVAETMFVDTIDDYQIVNSNDELEDITGFRITTEDYIVS